MVKSYQPQHGDIIFLNFAPASGHEQMGKRPALVVSNNTFNGLSNLAFVCPITNTRRNFPLHVPLDKRTKTTGYIMCEQLKALDLSARNAQLHERLPQDLIDEVYDILYGIIELE